MRKPDQRILFVGISGLLALFLGLQTLASFGLFGQGGWRWPFLDYPMYSDCYAQGAAVPVFGLTCVCQNGTRIQVLPADLNEDIWEFWKGPVAATRDGNLPTLQACLGRFIERKGLKLAAVELVNTPRALGRNGLEQKPVEVVARIDWKP